MYRLRNVDNNKYIKLMGFMDEKDNRVYFDKKYTGFYTLRQAKTVKKMLKASGTKNTVIEVVNEDN